MNAASQRLAAFACRAVARRPQQCRCCSATAIQKHLDARTASGGGLAERPGAALAQSREHALDMLAGPKAIDAMIDAAAGIVEAVEVADFHLVEAAAPRLHAERAEKWLIGSSASMATISVRPRQRRSATSSSSVVRQPSKGGGRSSTVQPSATSELLLFSTGAIPPALQISVPTHKGTLGGAGATSIETPVTAPGIPQSKQFGTPTSLRRVYAVQTCGLKALRGLASR